MLVNIVTIGTGSVFAGASWSSWFSHIYYENSWLCSSFGGANSGRPVRKCDLIVRPWLLNSETPSENHWGSAVCHCASSHFWKDGTGNVVVTGNNSNSFWIYLMKSVYPFWIYSNNSIHPFWIYSNNSIHPFWIYSNNHPSIHFEFTRTTFFHSYLNQGCCSFGQDGGLCQCWNSRIPLRSRRQFLFSRT